MTSKPSDIYRLAWDAGITTRPVIVLIGGYAGTGKSTLANKLAKHLSHAQVISTGIFRSIAQTQTQPDQNQALFIPTYTLNTLYGNDASSIRRGFDEQCAPVTKIIKSVINFLVVEKQHLIIEGNHVLPGVTYTRPDCTVIELYMYVDDPAQHREMLGGPTHNRTLSSDEFKTGRLIHDMLYQEAVDNDKPLFECSQTEQIESYFQEQLAQLIQQERTSAWDSLIAKQASAASYSAPRN